MDIIKGTSFFVKSNTQNQYPYLTKRIKTEVLIIGGGVTGAMALYQFAKQGYSCVLVDEARFGMRSTSITTALLQYELEDNYEDLLKKMSEEDVRAAYQLGSLGLEEIQTILNEIGNECEFERNDTLLFSNLKKDESALKTEYEYRGRMGYLVEFLDEYNNPTPFALKAGVYSKDGGARLNPCKFATQLREAASNCATDKQKIQLFENTKIKKLNFRNQVIIAKAQYGETIVAKKVVLATGYAKILGTKREFCKKQLTYNILVEPSKETKDLKIMARDNKTNYHYFRQMADGKIVFGGADTRLFQRGIRQIVSDKKYQNLFTYLNESFLKEKKGESICSAVSGVFGVTPDNLGVVGFDLEHPNLMYCLGYGANGILFATIGAKMLANECRGETQELLRLLNPFRNALKGL